MSANFSDVEKIIIAPQIVVYKNIFKHSKEIIELLRYDKDQSLFGEWKQWYEQGFRKGADPKVFNKIDTQSDIFLSEEMKYILEAYECMNFIRKDYLTDFDKDNGIWPSFIKEWSFLYNTDVEYYIDFFRYCFDRNMIVNPSGLIMEYHVDEIPVVGESKKHRHVATVNFYLNDDYEGGEICVYDSVSNKSYMYKPRQGDAVIMPSTEPFYHGVRPYDKADRYFMRAFIDTEVSNEIEWVKKYTLSSDPLVQTEEDYVGLQLQTIKLTIPPELIEVKG